MKGKDLLKELNAVLKGHEDDEIEFIGLTNEKGSWFTKPFKPKIVSSTHQEGTTKICIQDERWAIWSEANKNSN